MNNQTFTADIGDADASSPKSAFLRHALGYGAITAAIPYLLLKINWLTGGTLGMNDPAFFANPTYLIANAVTLAMDALAILLALTLTERWGNRVPPLLILFPVWMATGLLLPIIFILLFSPLAKAAMPASAEEGQDVLQAWVFVMVYGCFAAQGILLSGAFALYVRERWKWVFVDARADEMPDATRNLKRVLTMTAMTLSIITGIWYASWAMNINIGMSSVSDSVKSGIFYISSGVHAGFALIAAIGSALLFRYVSSRNSANLWYSLTLIWIGSADLFAWGAWELFVSLGINADLSSPIANLLRVTKMSASLLIVVTAAFVAAERSARSEYSEISQEN